MRTVLRWRARRQVDLTDLADLAAQGRQVSDLVPVVVGGSVRPHVIEIGVLDKGAEGTGVTDGERPVRRGAPSVTDGARLGICSGRLSDVILAGAGARRLA